MMRVYVAAPYESAAYARDVNRLLELIPVQPTSHWADLALTTPLKDAHRRVLRVSWEMQMRQLDDADVVLALPDDSDLAEVGRALCLGKPVIWVGPHRTASCFAPGVVMERCVDTALDVLAQVAKAGGRPYFRDSMLALAEKRHQREIETFKRPVPQLVS